MVKKIEIGIVVIVILLGVIVSFVKNDNGQKSSSKLAAENTAKSSATRTQVVTPTLTPTKKPAQSSTPSFNKNRGNNPVAAELAQQLFDQGNEIKKGIVLDTYIGLHPEDMQGKDKDTYIQTVDAAALAMQFDSSFWDSLDDDTRKSLITNYLKLPLGTLPANIVGITITNSGSVVVAKGTYDKRTDKANITLM